MGRGVPRPFSIDKNVVVGKSYLTTTYTHTIPSSAFAVVRRFSLGSQTVDLSRLDRNVTTVFYVPSDAVHETDRFTSSYIISQPLGLINSVDLQGVGVLDANGRNWK